MNLWTFASQAEFEKYGRKSRRELFLDEKERIVPRSAMLSLVRWHYAKAGNGRRPLGVGLILRTYFMQQCFSLSGPWRGRGVVRAARVAAVRRGGPGRGTSAG
jgi:IS5 family transposase